jgi:hypothetical protein
VQGSYLNVIVKIHIKECSKKAAPLLLSRGKFIAVGFERTLDSICTFYKYSALSFSNIAPSSKASDRLTTMTEAQERSTSLLVSLLAPDGAAGQKGF